MIQLNTINVVYINDKYSLQRKYTVQVTLKKVMVQYDKKSTVNLSYTFLWYISLSSVRLSIIATTKRATTATETVYLESLILKVKTLKICKNVSFSWIFLVVAGVNSACIGTLVGHLVVKIFWGENGCA